MFSVKNCCFILHNHKVQINFILTCKLSIYLYIFCTLFPNPHSWTWTVVGKSEALKCCSSENMPKKAVPWSKKAVRWSKKAVPWNKKAVPWKKRRCLEKKALPSKKRYFGREAVPSKKRYTGVKGCAFIKKRCLGKKAVSWNKKAVT